MNVKWTLGAAAALLLGTGVFATPAQADLEYMAIMDTPDGIVQTIFTQSELDVQLSCLVDAPTVPSCVNGPLTRISAASHGILLPIPSGFTTPAGTVPFHQVRLTSVLSSSSSERIFRCTIWEQNGGAVTFRCGLPASTGGFPPVGAPMTQTALGLFTAAHAESSPLMSDITAEEVWKNSAGSVIIPGFGQVRAFMSN